MLERSDIAFIGLGNMGAPMAGRLASAGFRVHAFDTSEVAMARIQDIAGATPHRSVGEAAAAAGVVILMLPNSAIVERVLSELLGSAAVGEGSIVIDMSSSDPVTTRQLAARLEQVGATLIDAPVSGGVKGASAGTLTVMVGATSDEFDRVRQILTAVGEPVHCGGTGAGHAMKALNNLLSGVHLWATSEVMETGWAFGLDPEVMLRVFNSSSGRSGSTENKWPNYILRGGYDSGFGLGLMVKDMGIAVALARNTGTLSAIGGQATDLWSRAAADLPDDADHTEVARWIASNIADGNERPALAQPPVGWPPAE